MRRRTIILGALLAVGQAPVAAWGGVAHQIIQTKRAFHPAQIIINRGDTLQFVNQDEFLHQIYVEAPNMTFESDEQPPGQIVTVTFPTAGVFAVRCHIHPKMLLTVTVR